MSVDSNATTEPDVSLVSDTVANDTDENVLVAEQQFRLLHKNALTGTVMVVPTVLIFLIVLWTVTPTIPLIAWCTFMGAVLLYRAIVGYRFLQKRDSAAEPLLFALAMYGCTWGVAGVVFFLSNSIPHQTFLTVMLVGSALGAFWSLHVSKSAVRIIVVPMLVPLAGRFFVEASAFGIALGTLVLFVAFALVAISGRAERSAVRPLRLGVQTASLREELSRTMAFLQTVLANINEALCAFDNDWRLSLHNEQLAHLLRLPPHLCRVGTPIEEIIRHLAEAGEFGEEDAEYSVDQLAALIQTSERQYYEHTRPDGTVIDIRYNPLPAGGLVATFVDATERKKVETALRESEAHSRNLVEGSIAGIVIHRDFKPLFVNQAWAAMHGYTPDEIYAMGTTEKCIATRELERLQAYKNARMRGEEVPLRYEYEGVRKDGSPVWLTVLVRVIDWEGEPAIQTTLVDITDLKQTEQLLRKSEESKAAVFAAAQESILLLDPDGTILEANETAARRFGKTLDEFIDRCVFDFMPPDVAAGRRAAARQLVESREPMTVEDRRDGRWFETSAYPILDSQGSVAQVALIARDITSRKAAEAALLESEARFKDYADTAADWFWEMGPDLRFTYMSERVEAVTGMPPGSFIGKTRQEIAETSATGDKWQRHLRDLRERKPFREFTYSRTTANGHPQYFSVSGKPLFDDNGVFVGYRGSARHVTAQVEAESQRSEFVSTVSHELRTPLTSIHGSLGLIKGGAAGKLPGKLKPMLDMAYNNSDRLVRLINDILDIEKFEAGEMKFRLRPTEVMPLVEQAVEASKGFADEREVKIIVGSALPGVKIQGDEDRLMQVLANLLSNAVKFSQRGDDVEIWVTRQEGSLRVGVSDNGPGIPQQFRDRIFEKYSQADGSISRQAGGTGLGLSISKAIVEKHGGDIGIDTETAKGTTFFFTLPELCEHEVDQ